MNGWKIRVSNSLIIITVIKIITAIILAEVMLLMLKEAFIEDFSNLFVDNNTIIDSKTWVVKIFAGGQLPPPPCSS